LIAVNPYWYGMYLYRDLEFVAGALIGLLFAMKNRKLNQPTIKDRIHTRIKTLVLKGLDVLGIPEDAPIELIIDSYPMLGRLIQYLE